MSRLWKLAALPAVALLMPALALRAQQPPAAPPPNEPTAKDVIKAVEKAEKAAEKKEAAKSPTDPVERIKEEGLKRSQVMETLSYLTDVIGPRLTASPNMKRANEWTRDRMAGWGLENAHLEKWGPFGRGWTLKKFSMQVVEPQCIPLIAYPKAWSPGVDGTLVAGVVYLDARTEADLEKSKGKLKGAVVLTAPPSDAVTSFDPLASRLTDKDLLVLADAPEQSMYLFARGGGGGAGGRRGGGTGAGTGAGGATARAQPPALPPAVRERMELARKRTKFLADEGAALLVEPSTQGEGGTLFVAQASVPGAAAFGTQAPGTRRASAYDKDAPKIPPQVVVAKEHYNRLVRMIRQGESLKVAVELDVRFHDDDLMAYNTVAEVPGTDLKDEVVMLGGHMDSWHSGTGATDNAAGVAVAMEAVRILKALDLKPRRTVRVALWSGEEQGLLGSRAYVTEHFGRSPRGGGMGGGGGGGGAAGSEPKEPTTAQKEEYEKFSAYFNLDNGTGKVRGIYLQGNEAVRPTFRKWLQPFREMGAATLTVANTGGTDHQSFDGIGLPGFQFIQDEIDYTTRTHHSNQDVFDRIQADDMKQAAVIMAAFVYNAATLDHKLPRKPSPPAAPRTETRAAAR